MIIFTKVTVTQTSGQDVVIVETNHPDPFDSRHKLTLSFSAPPDQGVNYARDVLGVTAKLIDVRTS